MLSGEQIPLGARTVLAVDAWHAMTSDRPYRQGISDEEAYKELEDSSGTQFDAEVVEAPARRAQAGSRGWQRGHQ